MKQLTLLLVATIILASCGKNKLPSELTALELSGLKGKVKTITNTTYKSCIYDGESWKPTTNSGYDIQKLDYDKDGFITKISLVEYFPALDSSESSYSYTLQKISQDNKIIAYTVTRQDTLGNAITDTNNIVWINDHIRLEYRNTEHGDTAFSYSTRYDNENRESIVKEKTRLNDGTYYTTASKYFYDKKGLRVKDSIFYNMHTAPQTYEVTYKDQATDKHGNIIYEFIEQHRNGDTSNMIKTVAIEYYD